MRLHVDIEQIPPEIEKPFRKALGHAARAETEELERLLDSLSDVQLAAAVGMCGFVAGYVAIDVCGGEFPDETNLRKIAKAAVKSASAHELGLTEQEAYDFLARGVLRSVPLPELFPDPDRMAMLPFAFAVNLLAAYLPLEEVDGWGEYLNKIEDWYEVAQPMDLALLPALLLRSRWLGSPRSATYAHEVAKAAAEKAKK